VGLQSGVEQIAAGYSHTCALLNTGAVRCWGTGHSGELGNGKLVVAQNTPVAPRGLSCVVELGLGDRSSCARLKNGTVRCWGENGTRQLGLPRPSPSVVLYPTTVYGLDGCVVPNVVGQGSDAAVATLQQRDCSIANRYVHSRVRRYHVVSQKPRPGTHLPNGGKVHLTISLGR